MVFRPLRRPGVGRCPLDGQAAAVFFLLDETLSEAFASLPAVPEGPQFVLDDEEAGSFRLPSLGFISSSSNQAIFGDQGIPGPSAVSEGRVPKGELKDVALGINVALRDEKVGTSNVMGLVQGTDPVCHGPNAGSSPCDSSALLSENTIYRPSDGHTCPLAGSELLAG